MDGVPVFLASLSRRNPINQKIVGTSAWTAREMAESQDLLRDLLDGIGNPTMVRIFRMQVTLCLHKAMRPSEIEKLPCAFTPESAIDLAGGPLEILYESVQGSMSTRPCANPGHTIIDKKRPDLFFPQDCGSCDSCRARKAIQLQRLRVG